MKKCVILVFLVFLLSLSVFAQKVTENEARVILGDHFISLNEARSIIPTIPCKLEIKYSKEELENACGAWLIPTGKIGGEFQYKLISIGYCPMILSNFDTLSYHEGVNAIIMLSILRPKFSQPRPSINSYIYRTKDNCPAVNGKVSKKSFAYNFFETGGGITQFYLPLEASYCIAQKDHLSYMTNNGTYVPIKMYRPLIGKKNIWVLEILYTKPQ
jgi:hypothetical protein